MKLNQLLQQKRHEANLTQDEVAAKLFVTRQTVSAWEKGINTPSIDLMLRISDLYQLPVEQLIKGDEDMFKTKMKKVVKQNKWYKKVLLSISGILILAITLFAFFGLGYEKQVSWIDRLNPILPKEVTYAHMPQHVKGVPEWYKSFNKDWSKAKREKFAKEYTKANQNSRTITEWVYGTFPNNTMRKMNISNQYKSSRGLDFNRVDRQSYKEGGARYIRIYNKGSYIYKAETVDKESVPEEIRFQIDEGSKSYEEQVNTTKDPETAKQNTKGIDL